MYTLQNIKDAYYRELNHGVIPRQDFETYLNTYYIKVFDDKLNFLGYEADESPIVKKRA